MLSFVVLQIYRSTTNTNDKRNNKVQLTDNLPQKCNDQPASAIHQLSGHLMLCHLQ